ncbi:MAG: AbrB family transcriptional regulator [Actinomycetota bacterium]|nr:AbrB family transcriptional regulator [Actinomycetota bacterium]
MTVAVVLIFGGIGAIVGYRLPVPAGVLVGTLVAVGIGGGGVALLGLPQLSVPPGTYSLLQILLGMLVGFRMTREELHEGAYALLPACLLAAIIISASVGAALVAVPLTSLDPVTALFAAAPGGLTEMTAVGASFGADGAAVASVQLVRVLLAVAVVDVVLQRLGQKGDEPEESGDGPESDGGDRGPDDGSDRWAEHKEDLKNLAVAAPWGIVGGLIGIATSLPAGGIIGALVCSAAFRLLTERPVPVGKFQVGVQIISGVVIGLGVSGDFLGQILQVAGAGALIISTQMVLWFAMSWLLVRFFDYDLPTATLAPSPGAISAVISTADEAGADPVVVTFIHLVRLNAVIIVVPLLVSLFFS